MANSYQSEQEALAGAGYPGYEIRGRAPIMQSTTTKNASGADVTTQTKVGEKWTVQAPDGKRAEISVTIVREPNSPSGNVYSVLDAGTKDTAPGAGAGGSVPIPSSSVTWLPDPGNPNQKLGWIAYSDGSFRPAMYTDPATGAQTQAIQGIDPKEATSTTTPASSIVWTDLGDGTQQGSIIVNGKKQDIVGLIKPKDVAAVAPDKTGFDWFPDPSNPAQEVYGRLVDGKLVPAQGTNGTAMTRPKQAKTSTANPNQTIWVPGDKPGEQKGVRVVLDENGNEISRVETGEIRRDANTLVGTGPDSPFIYAVDAQGNEIEGSRRDNPNYKRPVGTQLPANTEAPYIQILKPDGTIESVANSNRITVDEATSQLLEQVGLSVKAGSMSMQQAKDLLTNAINKMNADTSRITAQATQQNADTSLQESIRAAANNTLDYTQKNAQTGANLLQQRTQTAGSLLNQILQVPGQAAQGTAGRFGQIGGGLHGDVSGLYSGILGGIEGWTASLMGGQDTLDAAASFIKQANPNTDMTSPQAQAALGTLSQIYDRYQQISGGPHPDVAAQAAAKQTAGVGASGITAPVTNAVAGTVPNALAGQQQPQGQEQGLRPYVQSGQIFPTRRNQIGGMQSPITINIGGAG